MDNLNKLNSNVTLSKLSPNVVLCRFIDPVYALPIKY